MGHQKNDENNTPNCLHSLQALESIIKPQNNPSKICINNVSFQSQTDQNFKNPRISHNETQVNDIIDIANVRKLISIQPIDYICKR